ncbi:MAG: hypothetical protein FJ272_20385, partial [Planctomycetes bacterium]|nr:hypothetical protein [Planctomycetota bacterium]
MKTPSKIDLRQLYKSNYVTPKTPVLLRIKKATYLSITGRGAPGGPEFIAKIGALYAMAYTIKMTRKFSRQQNYTIGALEAQYWGEDGVACFAATPKEQWCWKLLIRTPEFVKPVELKQ